MAKLLKKKSHVSDEADATEETREIVGVWNHSHKRAPKGAQKVTGAGGPRAKPGNVKSAKETQTSESSGSVPRTRGGPGNMGWRWRGDGAARIRPPCEPRVCSWCPRLAASPPAHRLRSSTRSRYDVRPPRDPACQSPNCSSACQYSLVL